MSTSASTASTQADIATAKAVLTADDAVSTAADKVSTNADVVLTNADVATAEASTGAVAFKFTYDSTTSMANPTGTGGPAYYCRISIFCTKHYGYNYDCDFKAILWHRALGVGIFG